ncbi:MAG: outer membrane lipoprotein carrier protein LolA, partial [Deltaproteobacteria bacterium]|nr:outer membrane lipoprotein carrier protein LolA [Deltaproteobacteria bacterium]
MPTRAEDVSRDRGRLGEPSLLARKCRERVRRRQLLLGLAAAALVAAGGAQADSVDELLARTGAARASLRTLRARFRQTRTIGLLATAVQSRGELLLAPPGRLRWELFAPDGVTYWVGPEGFAVATAGGVSTAPRSAAGRFGAVLGDLMVMLGGDLRALRSRYELRAQEQPAGGLLIEARPKSAELRLNVHIHSLALDGVYVHEPDADRAVFHPLPEPTADEVAEL